MPPSSAPLSADASRLLSYIQAKGIDPTVPPPQPWDHMGAILAEAVLFKQVGYETTVKPRVANMIATQPGAANTYGLLEMIAIGGAQKALDWNGTDRLVQFIRMAAALDSFQIDTPADLRSALSTPPDRAALRVALDRIYGVGEGTLDQLDKLVGIPATAHGSRLAALAKGIGFIDTSYEHVSTVIKEVAHYCGWDIGYLDYALWESWA